ncbi:MAG: hypothetical protein GTO12_06210 [Proteobacteria bacterium]|nr:hypothetical protein [Pseudomonadota bacterium]
MDFKDFSLRLSQTKVGRFARELAAGRIMTTQCTTCRSKYYPPRADCSQCMTSEMDWIPLRARGKLVTFTMISVPPDHFASKVFMPFSSIVFRPCPVGLLEVEDGLKIMGWIPNVDPKDLRIGMPLQAAPHTLEDGKVTIILESVASNSEPAAAPSE